MERNNISNQLKSVVIDIENKIFKVNGSDIAGTGTYFNLVFEDGLWSLKLIEEKQYTTSATINNPKE